MSKDSNDCDVMNELFDSEEDNTEYYNHWRPVAYCDWEGNKIRKLTKEEQLKWIKQQKELNK